MKIQEKQEVVEKSWTVPILSFVLLCGLALLPLGRSSNEEKTIRARAKAEVLAYQVAQLYKESLASAAVETASLSPNTRSPASVRSAVGGGTADAAGAEGLMGQDPWGRAYIYRIQNMDGEHLRIEMRSPGPDGIVAESGGDDVLLTLSF